MKYVLSIGNTVFHFVSQMTLRLEEEMQPFLIETDVIPDVIVEIHPDYFTAPKVKGRKLGEDLLLEYYAEENRGFCLEKGSLSITTYDAEFKKINCYLNTERISQAAYSMGNLLRLLPMRMILQKNHTLFFHASQIAVHDIGILFTAPSGTGKTTQAKLWKTYRGAKIICNDRTLVRDGKTYSYPVDGSEPVISGESYPLGAIVLLLQSNENQIQKLKPKNALPKLMSQMIFDIWNSKEHMLAIENLIKLVEKYPVYLLSCTPDQLSLIHI